MFQIYTFLSYILIALYVSGCIIFNDLLIFFLLAFFVGFSNVHNIIQSVAILRQKQIKTVITSQLCNLPSSSWKHTQFCFCSL